MAPTVAQTWLVADQKGSIADNRSIESAGKVSGNDLNSILSPNVDRDLKVTFISDTHGLHRELEIPDDTDILIHAGDFTKNGVGVHDFAGWFVEQNVKHKVIISGNHDRFMDRNYEFAKEPIRKELLKTFKDNGIVYLEDSSTEIEGMKIYGTPWTTLHSGNKTFQVPEEELNEKFRNIPSGLDILISHSPPKGILDVVGGIPAGSQSLADIVREKKPRIHVFGHIHASHGQFAKDDTYFINAAIKPPRNHVDFKGDSSIEEVHLFDKKLPPQEHLSKTNKNLPKLHLSKTKQAPGGNTAKDPPNKPTVIVVTKQAPNGGNTAKDSPNKPIVTQSLFFLVFCIFFIIY